jgi:hypothetical protein
MVPNRNYGGNNNNIIIIIIGLYKNRMLAGAEHSIFEKLGNILPLCKELSEYTREIRGGPHGT